MIVVLKEFAGMTASRGSWADIVRNRRAAESTDDPLENDQSEPSSTFRREERSFVDTVRDGRTGESTHDPPENNQLRTVRNERAGESTHDPLENNERRDVRNGR